MQCAWIVQEMLWSRRLRTEQIASYEGIDLSHTGAGRPNETLDMLERLPERFTVVQACETLEKSKSAVQAIILRLIKAGLVRNAGTMNKKACYKKT